MSRRRKRGRPALLWFDGRAAIAMPVGTSLVIDPGGKGARIRGRVIDRTRGSVVLSLGGGRTRVLPSYRIARARVVEGRLEDGTLVVRFGVPADEWRGGIVRHDGQLVYVETLTGFEWLDEDELEDIEERLAPPPPIPAPRGRPRLNALR